MSLEKIIVFGNKSVARIAYNDLTYYSNYEVAGFTLDREHIDKDTLFELPVVPFDKVVSIFPPDEYKMIIAIGYILVNKLRAQRYYQAKKMGYQLISFISPKSTTYPDLTVGDNSQVGHNSVIAPDVKIGNNVLIGPNCVIGHDVVLHDHCFLSGSNAISGSVVVRPYCYLGTGSTIRNKVTIARECVIGAGAIILEDTDERSVYLGEPAKLLPITSDKLSLG